MLQRLPCMYVCVSSSTPPKIDPVTMTVPLGSLCVCERVVTPVSREAPRVDM